MSEPMKIVSWNINGLRSIARKGALKQVIDDADVLCLQEIRCDSETASSLFSEHCHAFPHRVWSCSAARKGYAGTAILTKVPVLRMDRMQLLPGTDEGRITVAWFEAFVLVNVYTPNSGTERHGFRTGTWDVAFKDWVQELRRKHEQVIVCGDFNVACHPADVCCRTLLPHVPAAPLTASDMAEVLECLGVQVAGLTAAERTNFADLLKECDLVDAFRLCNPHTVKYSWWSNLLLANRQHSRNTHGWRIDYFLVPPEMLPMVTHCDILDHVLGSDHAPVCLTLDF